LLPAEFGRRQLLFERPIKEEVLPTGTFDPRLLLHLSRIGNNLNQITRRLHQYELAVPDTLDPVLVTLHDILHRAGGDDH
jgi:hypothetical protein